MTSKIIENPKTSTFAKPHCFAVGLTNRGVLILRNANHEQFTFTKPQLNQAAITAAFGGKFENKETFNQWLGKIQIDAQRLQKERKKSEQKEKKDALGEEIKSFDRFQIIASTGRVFDKETEEIYSKDHFNTKFLESHGKFQKDADNSIDVKTQPFVRAKLYSKQFDYSAYRADQPTGASILIEGKEYMNTFTPSKLEKIASAFPEQMARQIIDEVESKFIENYLKLFPDFKIALAYMARSIIRPVEKINWFLHLSSPLEGTGKGLFGQIFTECLGKQNVHTDSGSGLHGEFTSHMFNIQLYLLNEGKFNKNEHGLQVLKGLVTETQLGCHQKGQDRTSKECLANVLYLSNKMNSYPITPNERRCTLLTSAFSTPEERDQSGFSEVFWHEFVDIWLRGDEGFAKILWYIRNHYEKSDYFEGHPFTCRENIKTDSWFEALADDKEEWQNEVDKILRDRTHYGCVAPFLAFDVLKRVLKGLYLKDEPSDKGLRDYIRRLGYKIPTCLTEKDEQRRKHQMFIEEKNPPVTGIVYILSNHSLMKAPFKSPDFMSEFVRTNEPVNPRNTSATNYSEKNGF